MEERQKFISRQGFNKLQSRMEGYLQYLGKINKNYVSLVKRNDGATPILEGFLGNFGVINPYSMVLAQMVVIAGITIVPAKRSVSYQVGGANYSGFGTAEA